MDNRLIVPLAVSLGFIFIGFFLQSGTVIGGDRDAGGCLVGAGYSFDQDVGACTRSWEIDGNLKTAAALAVNSAGPSYGLTVIAVEENDCSGCFTVTLRSGDTSIVKEIAGWSVND